MDFLQLIFDQIEQYLGREMTQQELSHANRKLKDEAHAIELFMANTAKKFTEWLREEEYKQ